VVRHLWRSLSREVTLCAEQEVDEYDVDPRVSWLAVLGNVMAGCAGFVPIVFGIIAFSSLQVVSVWNGLNFVLWRYVVLTASSKLQHQPYVLLHRLHKLPTTSAWQLA
jgi:hypothetical protein